MPLFIVVLINVMFAGLVGVVASMRGMAVRRMRMMRKWRSVMVSKKTRSLDEMASF